MRAVLPLSVLLFLLMIGLMLLPSSPSQVVSRELPQSKLAVLVMFDQMRGDYVEKWQPYFRADGFKRLQTQGAWYTDCQYPYGTTTTGPGHASVMTGTSGFKHGVVNNNWYDRKTGEDVYCAGSTRYEFVPKPAPPKPDKDGKMPKPKAAGTPDNLLSESLGDVLKLMRPTGKVFGFSLKDRSAIFPSGHKPDGAYWFTGQFVTSNYYRDALHPWVKQFNQSGEAQKYFKETWTRYRPDLDYTAIVGPDDGPGERKTENQTATFPHAMHGGNPDKITSEYYEALATSPYGNDLVLALAKECIIAEQLGQRDVTDLLTISFSSNDLVGHQYGPDSHEVFDITLRSDALMAELLNFLDQKVGPGNYTMVVTADHGICPLPEASAKKGLDALRTPLKNLTAAIEKFLNESYGSEAGKDGKPDRWLEATVLPNLYLNRKLLKAKNLEAAEVAAKLAAWLPSQTSVMAAYTAADLQKPRPDDAIFELSRASFFADRSGDVILVSKPLHLIDNYSAGTTHGAPHNYDTHAVFLAYGPGIPGGSRQERVTPQHAAPILAAALGLRVPKDCQYDLPKTLLKP